MTLPPCYCVLDALCVIKGPLQTAATTPFAKCPMIIFATVPKRAKFYRIDPNVKYANMMQ